MYAPPLRYRRGWLAIGWSLVFAVILSSLAPAPPVADRLFLLPQGDKIGHGLAYFILMAWFAQIYHAPAWRLGYMLGLISLGICLEILQGLSGFREADWRDVIANSAGIILAWQVTKQRLGEVLMWVERRLG